MPGELPSPALSAAEVALWHRQGYLGPYRLVSPARMAELRERIDEDIFRREADRPPASRNHDRHLDHAAVWELVSHPALVERVACLIGPDLLLWRSNFQMKEAGGDGVPWHQDSAYYGLDPCILVSAWIAIDAATPENGCLAIVPGSHTALPHHSDPSKAAFGKDLVPGSCDLATAQLMVLEPGEFVLFNEHTVHGSGPNRTQGRRLGLSPRIIVPQVRAPDMGSPLVRLRGTVDPATPRLGTPRLA